MPPSEFQVPIYLEYVAAFAWAASGTIVGMRKRYDIMGVFVVALLSTFGGSLLRDGLFLNQTPVMIANPIYLPLVLATTLIMAPIVRSRLRLPGQDLAGSAVEIIDAIGTPAFVVVGMQMSLAAGIPLPGVLLVGAVNGVGGGLLRDLMVGDPPSVLQPGLYSASLVVLVSVVFLLLTQGLGVSATVAAWGIMALFLVLRMLTLRLNWRTRPLLIDEG